MPLGFSWDVVEGCGGEGSCCLFPASALFLLRPADQPAVGCFQRLIPMSNLIRNGVGNRPKGNPVHSLRLRRVDLSPLEGDRDLVTFWFRRQPPDGRIQCVAFYLKATVLRMVDGDDKNDMGYLYEAMDHTKMELRQSLPRDYKSGYYLNPRLMNASNNAHVDSKGLQGTLNVIGRLSMTPEKRLEAELQLLNSKVKFISMPMLSKAAEAIASAMRQRDRVRR
ncbi:hypothetical protein Taro_051177 [Colocasia esculenta]|uniref:Uncharacterized protein n=1 Tax=Colocasia esculenta TaxID=4460 RepID=A0A843XFA2_COLES|nr:hypothetical protein [Colocasia esculenta]